MPRYKTFPAGTVLLPTALSIDATVFPRFVFPSRRPLLISVEPWPVYHSAAAFSVPVSLAGLAVCVDATGFSGFPCAWLIGLPLNLPPIPASTLPPAPISTCRPFASGPFGLTVTHASCAGSLSPGSGQFFDDGHFFIPVSTSLRGSKPSISTWLCGVCASSPRSHGGRCVSPHFGNVGPFRGWNPCGPASACATKRGQP